MTQASIRIGLLLALGACSAPPPAAPAARTDGDPVAWRPQPPRGAANLTDAAHSPNVLSPLPRGTRIALDAAPHAAAGIALPDGGCLPALNGVPRSSPVSRPKEHGSVPRVVGVTVDESGLEWYEHADGSMTTSRYVWSDRHGRWEPMTFHAVAQR